MRPWPSGQARACQVRQAGSTPAGRSRESANGRLPDLESGGGGSNPPSRIRGGSCWSLRHTLNVEVAGSIPAPGTRLHALTEAIRPDQGPVLKTGGGVSAACGFESHGFRLDGPGYANGRAARLKPGCLWVRLPPRALGRGCNVFGSVGNGQTTLA